jgi:hypothetical protein
MFSSAETVFPGLDRDGLLRPPSIIPPAVPNRSGDIFAELIHMLKGYPLHIRNEEHRAELLRDCRYFLFKGLEQKLIPYHISHNLPRGRDEITIRLEDIRQPGLSVIFDVPSQSPLHPTSSTDPHPRSAPSLSGWVHYSRPFVDSQPFELILEIGQECTRVDISSMRAEFFGDGKKRISRLFEVVANKLNLPTTQPLGLLMASGGPGSQRASPGNTALSDGDKVKVVVDDSAAITLDGQTWNRDVWGMDKEEEVEETSRNLSITSLDLAPPRKRRRVSEGGVKGGVWTVRTGQWRLRVQSAQHGKSAVECVLVAMKLDAYTGELARNERRGFLGG